jgi:hypothetical protein
MYKVSDNDALDAKIGSLKDPDNTETDINCYDFLYLYSAGEVRNFEQWIPVKGEVKELVLKTNASIFENVAMAFNSLDGTPSHSIVYNFNVPLDEFSCFGEYQLETTKDQLSFEGNFTITVSDVDCISKSVGQYAFKFTAL